jgi:hypothetical protein
MKEIFCVLASPREVFEDIANKPHWLIPALVCTVILFLIVWLSGCWQGLSDGLRVPNLLGPALISPSIVAIVSLGSTTFICLMHALLGGRTKGSARFRTILSVNMHCGLIFLLGETVNDLLVRSNLLSGNRLPLPNRFPTGLDLFLIGVNEPNQYVAIILHSTSVFVLWYLIVLSLGIRVITGSGKIRAGVIAASLWIVAVAIGLGMTYAAGGGTTIRIAL